MQGIFIVELLNKKSMPVTRDKRYIDDCAKVSRLNIKVGKTIDFTKREQDYFKDFDQENVIFTPLAKMDITQKNKKGIKPKTAILRRLKSYQMKSPKNGQLEWLENISTDKVIKTIFSVLKEDFKYEKFS